MSDPEDGERRLTFEERQIVQLVRRLRAAEHALATEIVQHQGVEDWQGRILAHSLIELTLEQRGDQLPTYDGSYWGQTCCERCWRELRPGEQPVRVPAVLREQAVACSFCGGLTRSGIYFRLHPDRVPYPSRDSKEEA